MAAVMRPDIVITSAILGAINGTDLVRALTVMSITAATRFAVVTSFDRDHPELRNLSTDVPILRPGDTLEADLDHATAGFEERQVKIAYNRIRLFLQSHSSIPGNGFRRRIGAFAQA
ncbi:MAG: hypothetical protein VCB77_05415, partial [Alphaproteobacteria bacterium]